MPEWLNGAVSKTVVPLRVPRVRIPLSPPVEINLKKRRGDREAEGARLEIVCRVCSSTEGSNPSLSASFMRILFDWNCSKLLYFEVPGTLCQKIQFSVS